MPLSLEYARAIEGDSEISIFVFRGRPSAPASPALERSAEAHSGLGRDSARAEAEPGGPQHALEINVYMSSILNKIFSTLYFAQYEYYARGGARCAFSQFYHRRTYSRYK